MTHAPRTAAASSSSAPETAIGDAIYVKDPPVGMDVVSGKDGDAYIVFFPHARLESGMHCELCAEGSECWRKGTMHLSLSHTHTQRSRSTLPEKACWN